MAGDEAAQQLYPFRANICRTLELGGLTNAQDMQAAHARWPFYQGMAGAGMIVNDDGTVRLFGCFILLLCITLVCVALPDLIAQTLAPLLASTLHGDFHARGTLLIVVQHKQHRLELHRLAAFAGCTHPLLHSLVCTLVHVGQSFDGRDVGARRALLRRHHMGSGRAPGRSAFLLLRHLFHVICHF
jgi:hypothetical protein